MLIKSLRHLSAASAALAAFAGVWLAFDSVQLLIEQFRLAATLGILASAFSLLVASALLVRCRSGGTILAATCAIASGLFVVGGLSHMGNIPLGEAFAQATCPRDSAVCFPQAATFIYALAMLGIVLVASGAFMSLASKRDV